MSVPLSGSPDCILYNYLLVGGPLDGEVSNGFRPYFQLVIAGAIYETESNIPEEYIEWVNDGTRQIRLYYKGQEG